MDAPTSRREMHIDKHEAKSSRKVSRALAHVGRSFYRGAPWDRVPWRPDVVQCGLTCPRSGSPKSGSCVMLLPGSLSSGSEMRFPSSWRVIYYTPFVFFRLEIDE
ncbi:hypothetical protein MRX96_056421 [Rhipicephalus microplus]